METKISKAQKEVWEWKEEAYRKFKHLKPGERIRAIIKSAEKTRKNLQLQSDKLFVS